MPSDALHFELLTQELCALLSNGRVEKIIQNSLDIIFSIRKNNFTHNLLLSANPNYSRIHTTSAKITQPKTTTAFCTHLKKHLSGALLRSMECIENERIILLHFDTSDELGIASQNTLICELMGRRSNIILVNSQNKITDCLHKASIDQSTRPMFPGIAYQKPPSNNPEYLQKLNQQKILARSIPMQPCIVVAPNNAFIDFCFCTQWEMFCNTKFSMSTHLSNENSTTPPSTTPLSSLQQPTPSPLQASLPIEHSSKANAKALDPYATPQQANALQPTLLQCDTLSSAIDQFYTQKLQCDILQNTRQKMLTQINHSVQKLKKNIQVLQAQLDSASDAEKNKLYGELLTAYMYQVKYGDSQATCLNYYDNTTVTIPLDSKKSPAQNAQNYYHRYNKKVRTIKVSTQKLEESTAQLDYALSLIVTIQQATTLDDLQSIAEECVASGHMPPSTKKSASMLASEPRKFLIDDHTLLIGKNNIQNDQLVRKSHSLDIWLHASQIHGCHGVIKPKDRSKPVSLATIQKAAQLVAYYSKAKSNDKVPIDYCPIKNVSKPRGSLPGKVIYHNQKTIWVNPNVQS